VLIAVLALPLGAYLASEAMAGTLNSRWYPWKVHESKRIGDQLVQAIESYKHRSRAKWTVSSLRSAAGTVERLNRIHTLYQYAHATMLRGVPKAGHFR
jgi:hypothetical protein